MKQGDCALSSPIRRMFVALRGEHPEDDLLRYAAMVARATDTIRPGGGRSQFGLSARSTSKVPRLGATALWVPPFSDSDNKRSRRQFRLESAHSKRCGSVPPAKARFETAIRSFFDPQSDGVAIRCDVLNGNHHRVYSAASEFEPNVLLLEAPQGSYRSLVRLANESPWPVWFVPPQSAPITRRILVPIDFTTKSIAALQTAMDIAARFSYPTCVAAHFEPPTALIADEAISGQRKDFLLSRFEALMALVSPRRVEVQPRFVRAASVAQGIARIAEHEAIDLAILTVRSRGRFADLIHRSCVKAVLGRTNVPLLVLRPEQRLGAFEALSKKSRSNDLPQYS